MNFRCPQCGAGSTIEYEEYYFKCPFCKTSLVLDISNVTKHFITLPKITVDKNYCVSHLKTFLAKNEIRSNFIIDKYTTIYYPFWCHIRSDGTQVILPAASSQLFDIKALNIKAGEFLVFEPSKISNETVIDADIHLESSLGQFGNLYEISNDPIKESSLIHYPFSKIEYRYNNNRYDILMDMITEEFYYNVLPPTISGVLSRRFAFISIILFFLFIALGMIANTFELRILLFVIVSVPLYFFLKKYIEASGG